MADRVPESVRLTDGLYLVGFGLVAMYVVDAGEFLVAFDAGMRAAALSAEFSRLGLDPARVRHLFLTHSDTDHTGGLAALSGARVHLSRNEVPMITRVTPRFLRFVYNRPLPASFETLDDGQELTLGTARVRCIATPGHTPGSMSFLVNGTILIVGDILNLDRGRAVMDRGMINMDAAARRDSIRRLARLEGVSLLCTMHSGCTADFARAMAEWRR
jgi:hydroxyacylglutathione hydrolase